MWRSLLEGKGWRRTSLRALSPSCCRDPFFGMCEGAMSITRSQPHNVRCRSDSSPAFFCQGRIMGKDPRLQL